MNVNEISRDGDCLNSFERVAHHGNEHVSEDDNNGDVVQRKQEQSDTLDHRRGVSAAREARCKLAVVALVWVFDLDFVYSYETEHRPEQAEQRPWQPVTIQYNTIQYKNLQRAQCLSVRRIGGADCQWWCMAALKSSRKK